MPVLSTVILTTKGECRKANLQLTSESSLTMEIIQKYFKKKEEPELVCVYDKDHGGQDRKRIAIFGYKKGKKGTENKTELPDPYSELVLFGDALVIASSNATTSNATTSNATSNATHNELLERPLPFTTDQWAAMCQRDEDDEENDEDDEENDEDDEEEEEEKSVKDAFEESDSEDKVGAELVEEEEEVPVVVKRKRAAAYSKVDTSALKEEISMQSEPETHPLRLKCIAAFAFLEPLGFNRDEIRSLEKGIFEATYQHAQKQYIARSWRATTFCEVYRQLLRSVLSNLHPQSPVNNTRLLLRVKEGEFALSAIPFMNAYEMYPEKWFALKDKLLLREQKILEGNKSRATDQFKCRRCHKKECTYYELQTRSADEPMTIFITCLNCGKEWRQGG